MLNQQLVAKTIGVTLLVVGLLGFITNPLVGASGLFETDLMHNLVHIVTGAIFAFVGFAGSGEQAKMANTWLGAIYLVVALAGFVVPGVLEAIIVSNMADHGLHLLLGVVLLVVGLRVGVEEGTPTA